MKQLLVAFSIFFATQFSAQQTETSAVTEAATVGQLQEYGVIAKKMNLKDVVLSADVKPEYPGGFGAFGRKFSENMETVKLKNNEELDTKLYFVVEKDGYIRNSAAIGSNKKHVAAAEAGMKRVFERWKPAQKNGKPVRYLYIVPLFSKKY